MLKVTKNINFKAVVAGAAFLTILSTLVPNIAEARGSGGRASGSRVDDFVANYEFDLYTSDLSGKPRTPDAGGTFVGAIENFTGSFDPTDDLFSFNYLEINSANSLTLDLTPRFISAKETIKLLNGNDVIDYRTNNKITAEKDRIEYDLTGDDLSKLGISELTLFIEKNSSNFNLFNNQALTSIDYIVDNKLLELVNGIRVSGLAKADPNLIISNETTDDTPQDGDGTVRNINFTASPVAVPESSNILGLLVLGGLGTSLLLKQKVEQA